MLSPFGVIHKSTNPFVGGMKTGGKAIKFGGPDAVSSKWPEFVPGKTVKATKMSPETRRLKLKLLRQQKGWGLLGGEGSDFAPTNPRSSTVRREAIEGLRDKTAIKRNTVDSRKAAGLKTSPIKARTVKASDEAWERGYYESKGSIEPGSEVVNQGNIRRRK